MSKGWPVAVTLKLYVDPMLSVSVGLVFPSMVYEEKPVLTTVKSVASVAAEVFDEPGARCSGSFHTTMAMGMARPASKSFFIGASAWECGSKGRCPGIDRVLMRRPAGEIVSISRSRRGR